MQAVKEKTPADLAETRFALARAVWPDGDRARALELAATALALRRRQPEHGAGPRGGRGLAGRARDAPRPGDPARGREVSPGRRTTITEIVS